MRNKRKQKRVICGMLFPKAIYPVDILIDLSEAASAHLGLDIPAAVVFSGNETHVELCFNTRWSGGHRGFILSRYTGIADADYAKDLVCMLGTARSLPDLRSQHKKALKDKIVFDRDSLRDFVHLCVEKFLRHAYLEEAQDRFCVVGDTYWIPPSFMENHECVGKGEKSFVRIHLQSLTL